MNTPIKNYEGRYSINEEGDVYSNIKGKIIANVLIAGYLCTHLSSNGKAKYFKNHRLVAQAYLPDYSENLQVNHKDCNKLNNHVSNLEMVTAKQNMQHAAANGRRPDVSNENNPMCKLTNREISEILYILTLKRFSQREIGNMYGVVQSHICSIGLQNKREIDRLNREF